MDKSESKVQGIVRRILAYICFVFTGLLISLLSVSLSDMNYGEFVPLACIMSICFFLPIGIEFYYNEMRLFVYVSTLGFWLLASVGILIYPPVIEYFSEMTISLDGLVAVLSIVVIIVWCYIIYCTIKELQKRKKTKAQLIKCVEVAILNFILSGYSMLGYVVGECNWEYLILYKGFAIIFLIIGMIFSIIADDRQIKDMYSASVLEKRIVASVLLAVGIVLMILGFSNRQNDVEGFFYKFLSWGILLLVIGSMLMKSVSKCLSYAIVLWLWSLVNVIMEYNFLIYHWLGRVALWLLLFTHWGVTAYVVVLLIKMRKKKDMYIGNRIS